MIRTFIFRTAILSSLIFLAACNSAVSETKAGPGKLQIVATTSILGDVVRQVGADHVNVTVLMEAGTDPHSFEPSPKQAAAMSEADIIFVNGLNLEETLKPLLASIEEEGKTIVAVSDGVETIEFQGDHEDGQEADLEHGADPHVWLDPNNVMLWVDVIERALSAADPAHAADYHSEASDYQAKLKELDAWIRTQIAQIPEDQRQIVTDHTIFAYFAKRYGLEQVGAVVNGYSTLAAPTAQELAALEDDIKALGVKALFVGNTTNPSLSERVAADTGVKLIFVYTGSLSEPGGPAADYLDYMRYNVNAFVDNLK